MAHSRAGIVLSVVSWVALGCSANKEGDDAALGTQDAGDSSTTATSDTSVSAPPGASSTVPPGGSTQGTSSGTTPGTGAVAGSASTVPSATEALTATQSSDVLPPVPSPNPTGNPVPSVDGSTTASGAESTEPAADTTSAGGASETAAGGSANDTGGSPGAAATAAAGGSGAGGDVNPPGIPCPVPGYIFADTSPVGWASESGGTTGGGAAEPILVTSLEQLKMEVADSTAKVLYVDGSFAPDNIKFGSNKTLIGCSSGAELKGHLQIGSGSSNIIVRNIAVSGYGAGDCSLDPGYDSSVGCSSGDDAISVNGTAHHVWFDHCSVKDGTDGNLDITNNADFVTVSWTKFSYTPRTDNSGDDSTGASGHRYSNLVGGTDDAPSGWPGAIPLNVTWHHNWWADNVVERMPRVRYGRNHLFNNYYDSDTSNYCVRAGIESQVLLQANYFDGVDSPHEFNGDDDATAYITVGEGALANVYNDTSGSELDEGEGTPFTEPPYEFEADSAEAVPAQVKAGAGPH